jgi:peptide/nickel transport system permease protein
MGRRLLRSFLAALATLIAASALIFSLMRLLPGDPVLSIFAGSAHSLETRAALRAELGLDRPLLEQYGQWLWSMLRGEFGGRSLVSREPIGSLLARQVPVTLLLSLYALLASLLFSIPLGIAAALARDRWPDRLIRVLSVGGSSLPMVLLSLGTIVVLLKLFRWSPPIIYSTPREGPAEHALIMLFPTLLLAWEYGGPMVRVLRASMLDALGSDYIVTARAKGLPETTVVLKHALRGSLIPSSAVLGLQWGTLVGGVLVVETIFGLPGVGRGLVQAALARDYPVVQTVVTLLVFFHIGMSAALDALHRVLDPRLAHAASL